MQIIKNPKREDWSRVLLRPNKDVAELTSNVKDILKRVRIGGDTAVKEYELLFDKVSLDALQVTESEIEEAESHIGEDLRRALVLAHSNIACFHEHQRFECKEVFTQQVTFSDYSKEDITTKQFIEKIVGFKNDNNINMTELNNVIELSKKVLHVLYFMLVMVAFFVFIRIE